MGLHPNIPKVIQAAALILRNDRHQRMPYIRLLKLLYVIERESLRERGRPVFGDRVVSMEHGPVMSATYDLVKQEHSDAAELALWVRFFRTEGFQLELQSGQFPGIGDLSKWEIEKIHEVNARYAHLSEFEIVDLLHRELPEWEKPQVRGPKAVPIPLAAILKAVGRHETPDEVAEAFGAGADLNRFLKELCP